MILLNNPNQVFLHRTIKGKYYRHQATVKTGFLDVNWNRSVPIWPGMAMMRTSGVAYPENAQSFTAGDIVTPVTQAQNGFPSGAESAYTLLNNVGVPAGLCANYIGGDGIDELDSVGVDGLGIWTLNPDAEVEILAPAFDAVTFSWQSLSPTNGTDLLIYARTANLTGGALAGLSGQGGPLGTYGLQGQLVPSTDVNVSVQPVARLISVNSATSITIGGLAPRHNL
jgi:hypothetical protein